jgi:SnoaL-like domain
VKMNERMLVEQQCRDLVTRLVHYYDHGDAEAAASLFIPDGTWVKSRVPYRGRAAIIDSFAAQPSNLVMRHVTSNILIDVVNGTYARGVTYYLAYVGRRDRDSSETELPLEQPGALGEWYDTFEETTEGWRFARREGKRIFGRRG